MSIRQKFQMTIFVALLACLPVVSQTSSSATAKPKSQAAGKARTPKAGAATERRAGEWQRIKIPPLPPFKPQQPKRLELPNGLVIFLQEDRELPLIEGTFSIRDGARVDPANKVGLVNLYGRTWRTGGTKARSGDELDDFLEARAARVETGGGIDSTSLSWSCLKGDFDDVLKVVQELLREPEFREDKLALAKQAVNSAIARRNDDPGSIARREATKLAYGADNPYARTSEYATVAAVTRQDLMDWHAKYNHPNNSILGVYGDFDAAAMEQKLRAAFQSWPKGPKAVPPKIEFRPSVPGVYFAAKEDVNQSNVRLVHLGIRRDNPDYYAVTVMNEIFGGGFSSRLVTQIRTIRGLAYSVGGGVGTAYDHPGIFTVAMGTKSENTVPAVKALDEEFDKLKVNAATPEELKRAKDTILNSFVFEYDEKDKVLAARMDFEFYGYPADFLERFQAAVKRVTADDVARVARKYVHKEKLAKLVVGKQSEFGRELSELGPVTVLDISIPEGTTAKPAQTRPAGSNPEGKALVARVAESFGGAVKQGAVKAIRQKVVSVRRTEQGDVPIEVAQTVLYPDRAAVLMQTPVGAMSMVITPGEGFRAVGANMQPMDKSELAENSKSIRRDPVYLAQHSSDPKFQFAVTGMEKVGGTNAKVVEINADGAETRWYIDPANGRLLRAVFKHAGSTRSHAAHH
ncbi:MAG: insulinase family protein [Acidobacteriales bacterium]|nr:insulinase family protein [Terriglobales bacterium]